MASDAKKITIQVEVDDKGAVTALKNVSGAVEAVGAAARTSLSGWQAFSLGLTGVNAALQLLSTGAKYAGEAVAFLFQGVTRGAAFADLAAKTGVAVETLSSLELAAKTSGTSLDALAIGLKGFANQAVAAASGSKEAGELFRQVGVSAKDVANGILPMGDALKQVAARFAEMPDGARKTALAVDLFGRAGLALIPLLNEGSAGLERYQKIANAFGLTIGGATAKALDDFEDNLTILHGLVAGAAQQLAVGMAPALKRVTDALVDAATKGAEGNNIFKSLGESIGEATIGGVRAAAAALQEFLITVNNAGLGPALLQTFARIFDGLVTLAKATGKLMGAALYDGVVAALSPLANSSTLLFLPGGLQLHNLIVREGKDFEEAGQQLRDHAAELVKGVSKTLNEIGKDNPQVQKAVGVLGDLIVNLDEAGQGLEDTGNRGRKGGAGVEDFNKKTQDLTKSLTEEVAKQQALQGIWAQAADGVISYAEAQIRAAAAEKEAGKEGANAATAALALKAARAEIAAKLSEETAKQVEETGAVQAGTAAFTAAIAARKTVAQATQEASDAEATYKLTSEAAASGDEKVAAAALKAAEGLRAANEERRRAIAEGTAQAEINSLTTQLDLLHQAAAGAMTYAEANRQIAIQAEVAKGVSEELAAKLVDAQKAVQDAQRGMISMGDVLKGAFDQVFDAIINGTQDLGNVFKSIGISIGKRLFDSMLESKLDFDQKFKFNIADLGAGVINVLGGAFDSVMQLFSGGGGGGGGDGGFNLGSLLSGASGQAGGGFNPSSASVTGYIIDDAGHAVPMLASGVGSLTSGEFGGFDIGELQLTSPGNYVELGAQGPAVGWSPAGSGGSAGRASWMSSAAGIAAGALAGYAAASALPATINDLGITGLAARGLAGSLSTLNGIMGASGAILGAFLGYLTGGAGGGLGGLIAGGVGKLIAGSIDRGSLLGQKGYSGNVFAKGSFGDIMTFLDPHFFALGALLGLPTLGTALRRGGESLIDASPTFQGLQAKFGDWTRSEGGPFRLTRNYLTGPETAASRGMTQEQIQSIWGGTEGLFGFIGRNEKFPADMGSVAQDQGRIMAEFLSRGLAQGMKYEELFASLRQFASEAGITFTDALSSLPKLMEGVTAEAKEFQKGLPPGEAEKWGAIEYGRSLVGLIDIYKGDFPKGTQIATVALQNMTKDGVTFLSTLSQKQKDALAQMSPDQLRQTFTTLAEGGWELDVSKFKGQLDIVAQSTAAVGQGLAAAITSDDVEKSLLSLSSQIQQSVKGQAAQQISDKVMEKTGIGSSFEGAYGMLDKLKEVDIMNPDALKAWGGDFQAALADGQARLMEYLPLLQQVQDAMEAAFNADTPEAVAVRIKEATDANKQSIEDTAKALYNQGLTTGDASGVGAQFSAGARANVLAARTASVAKGFAESERGQTLARELAEYQEAMRKAAGDPALMAAAEALGQKYLADADAYGAELQKQTQDAADAAGTRLQVNADTVKASLGGAINSALSALDSGNAGDAAKALAEGIGGTIKQTLQAQMVQGLIEQSMIPQMVAPLMAEMQAAIQRGASPEELAGISAQIAQVVKTGTAALMPAIEGINKALDPLSEKNLDKVSKLTESGKTPADRVREEGDRQSIAVKKAGDDAAAAATSAGAAVTKLGDALKTAQGIDPTAAQRFADALKGAEGLDADAAQKLTAALQGASGVDPSAIDKFKQALQAGQDIDPTAVQSFAEALQKGTGVEPDQVEKFVDALKAAEGVDPTKAGQFTTALQGLMRGVTDDVTTGISDGLGALKDELGVEKNTGMADGIRDALASGAGGVADAIGQLIAALNPEGIGVAGHASGGTIPKGGVGIVGERGRELVVVNADGSVTVIPLEGAAAASGGRGSLGGGPGTGPATRGPVHEPHRGGPGDTSGPIYTPPGLGGDDNPLGPGQGAHPRVPRGGGRPVLDVNSLWDLKLDISGPFKEYVASGDFASFEDALGKGINDTMREAMIKVLLESGPIAAAVEQWTSRLSSETAKAMKDGIISPEEEEALRKVADDAKRAISGAAASMKPAIDAIRSVFGGDGIAGNLTQNLNGAIEAFAKGGSRADLREAINEQVYEGVLQGIISGVLASGPIQAALSTFSEQMQALMSSALEDGIVTGAEGDAIGELGSQLASTVTPLIAALGPAFRRITQGFGIGVTSSAQRVRDTLGSSISGAFFDATKGGTPPTFGDMAKSIRNSIYQKVRDGMISAFVDSAVVQGLLSGPLASIDDIFTRIGNHQLTIAEANLLLAQQTAAINGALADPNLSAMFAQISGAIGSVGAGLGIVADNTETATQSFNDAASAAENAQCTTCELEKKSLNFGMTALTSFGRMGQVEAETWMPKAAAGAVLTGPRGGYLAQLHGREMVLADPRAIGLGGLAAQLSGAGGGDDVVAELRALRASFGDMVTAIAEQPVTQELKIGDEVMVRAMGRAKRVARKMGKDL